METNPRYRHYMQQNKVEKRALARHMNQIDRWMRHNIHIVDQDQTDSFLKLVTLDVEKHAHENNISASKTYVKRVAKDAVPDIKRQNRKGSDISYTDIRYMYGKHRTLSNSSLLGNKSAQSSVIGTRTASAREKKGRRIPIRRDTILESIIWRNSELNVSANNSDLSCNKLETVPEMVTGPFERPRTCSNTLTCFPLSSERRHKSSPVRQQRLRQTWMYRDGSYDYLHEYTSRDVYDRLNDTKGSIPRGEFVDKSAVQKYSCFDIEELGKCRYLRI